MIAYTIALCYMLYNVATAWLHARQWRRAKAGRPYFKINHTAWAALYLGLCMPPVLIGDRVNFWLLAALLIGRKPIFDIAYNCWRGLPPLLATRPTATSSKIDKIHWAIFGGNTLEYQAIYFLLFLYLLIFKA